MTYALWFVQILLALLFLFAGGMKLALPIDTLGLPFLLPAVFVRFVGMCEVLGALGLLLPGALRTRTELTPLAALGLTTIMVGATMFTPPDEAAARDPAHLCGATVSMCGVRSMAHCSAAGFLRAASAGGSALISSKEPLNMNEPA